MSISCVNAVLRGVFGIDPTAKLILIILAEHTNRNGVAWPSVATIARYACISEHRTKHVLRKLQEDEWFALESKGSRPGRTSRRRLNMDKLVRKSVADDTISKDENVSPATPLTSTDVSPWTSRLAH